MIVECLAKFTEKGGIKDLLLVNDNSIAARTPVNTVINYISTKRLELSNADLINEKVIKAKPNSQIFEFSAKVTTDKAIEIINNITNRCVKLPSKKANAEVDSSKSQEVKKETVNKTEDVKEAKVNTDIKKEKQTNSVEDRIKRGRVQMKNGKTNVSYAFEDHSVYEGALQTVKTFEPYNEVKNREAIAKYRELTDEREKQEMISLITCHNMALVLKRINPFRAYADDIDDLLQAASMGLFLAIKSFDLDKKTAFSTHAWNQMLGQITAYRRKAHTGVNVPAYMRDYIRKYKELCNSFNEGYHREPTEDEVMENLNINEDTFDKIIYFANATTASINSIVSNDDSDTELGDMIADERVSIEGSYEQKELKERLDAILSGLSDFDRNLLELDVMNIITDDEIKILLRNDYGDRQYTSEEVRGVINRTRKKITQNDIEVILKAKYGDALSRQGRSLKVKKLLEKLSESKKVKSLKAYI